MYGRNKSKVLLKLQPIKLTVLLNSAWDELSNTDCTMSVRVYTAVQGSHSANQFVIMGYKRMGWHQNTASFWQGAVEAAPSLWGNCAQPAWEHEPMGGGGKLGMPKL